MLSPHTTDPTLTTDLLMEVVKGVEAHWWYLGIRLGVPRSKRKEVERLYHSDHHRMEAVLDYYVKYYPAPSCSLEYYRGWGYTSRQMRSLPNMSKVWM